MNDTLERLIEHLQATARAEAAQQERHRADLDRLMERALVAAVRDRFRLLEHTAVDVHLTGYPVQLTRRGARTRVQAVVTVAGYDFDVDHPVSGRPAHPHPVDAEAGGLDPWVLPGPLTLRPKRPRPVLRRRPELRTPTELAAWLEQDRTRRGRSPA